MNELHQFSEYLKTDYMPLSEGLPDELQIDVSGDFSMYYAPFEFVNSEASVIICGITPGLSQAKIALAEAQKALREGATVAQAAYRAKHSASFAGPMRRNLVSLLDSIDVHGLLGIESTEQLFTDRTDLVHYTSALRYPVFKNGKNYSGTPSMVATPFLRNIVDSTLGEELARFNEKTLIIPLGGKVEEALLHLSTKGLIRRGQILSGIPHPSGANAERIQFFLGRKEESDLSKKTNAKIINQGREVAIGIVAGLR
ncbi:hypothetical protein [Spongiibacter marinus]|uniref:hypothetical protein n=1 Tax=Spongiibacter marinus TaxID=354246 RepID=UPI000415795A|nr:hypothetical protein [Spongiibacter marinus]